VRQPLPGFVEFQHPQLVAEPPSGAHWLHEIKFDGYRFQARIESGGVTLFTRRGHDWTDKLPELAADLSDLRDGILDGELCYLDPTGKPTFSGLRSAMGKGQTAGLVFYAFDILWRGQDDLRPFPLRDRKEILETVLAPIAGDRVRLVEAFPTGGATLLKSACNIGVEGIVSKRRDARYQPGRGDTWVKAKCKLAQEFVIGGWVQEAGRHFKGILVGVQGPKGLTYVGALERGFSAAPDLARRLQPLETKANPFKAGDPPRSHVRWVEPRLVCQAEFQEWTASGKIRHASFRGLRDDKAADEVRREVAGDVL
jgi:bifunctional non-homologous end joining protein LigD